MKEKYHRDIKLLKDKMQVMESNTYTWKEEFDNYDKKKESYYENLI